MAKKATKSAKAKTTKKAAKPASPKTAKKATSIPVNELKSAAKASAARRLTK